MADDIADDFSNVEAETTFEVQLYIYDLSKGLAGNLSSIFLGKHLPGIWHTGIVAYGREYFFGSDGINSCGPGETILGEPDQILNLGKTEIPYSIFLEFIFALGESSYRPGCYDLLKHNCNNFSQDTAIFLTGRSIPQEILDLPQEVLNTPIGEMLKVEMDKLNLRAEGSKGLSFGAIPPPTSHRSQHNTAPSRSNDSASRRDRRQLQTQDKAKEDVSIANEISNNFRSDVQGATTQTTQSPVSEADKKENILSCDEQQIQHSKVPDEETEQVQQVRSQTCDSVQNIESSPQIEQQSSRSPESILQENFESNRPENTSDSRGERAREPPVVYSDIDGVKALINLAEIANPFLGEEDKSLLLDFEEYLKTQSGAWALGSTHLDLLGHLLNDEGLSQSVRIFTLKMLQAAVFKEDIILLLHQDRKDHHIMRYINKIEKLSAEEQEEISKLLCNLCYNYSSFDWLMYISEWEEHGQVCSNCKVTVRAAVHAILSDAPSIREKGAALIYNLALKEQLFDDTATELATAVLQFLQGDVQEEAAFQCLTALLRFLYISYNDVPALVQMLGPEMEKFNGKSERVDQLVEQIQFKLSVSISA
ncbi:uncharacterized protein LOC143224962 [Tachypleus tridentatus]|uniref:uncharacterized protein LOC143224962 n=1 Tax=Tachypleus tridentatus TaxID=6853 RepID=UPI003FD4B5F5